MVSGYSLSTQGKSVCFKLVIVSLISQQLSNSRAKIIRMNQQIKQPVSDIQPESPTHVLHTITPVSKYLALVLFITLPFIGGWIGYQNAPVAVPMVEVVQVAMPAAPIIADATIGGLAPIDDRDERIARLLADPTLPIDTIDDFQAVLPFVERSGIYASARAYMSDNNVADEQSSLVFDWKRGDWIRFTVIPESVETDNALLFMRLVDDEWTTETFGTAFPDLYEAYPELMVE